VQHFIYDNYAFSALTMLVWWQEWNLACNKEGQHPLEPSLMARFKASVNFLLTVIELLFLSLTADALQGKPCQNSLPFEGVSQFEPRFQGEGVLPEEYFLVSTKLDTCCYLTVQTAQCYMQSF